MTRVVSFWLIFGAFFVGSNCLIVPGEIPTLLSLIYSNIPTIKKGTDSRLGWGFRLGNRADFQVLVELGPQTNTQPLGNQEQPSSSSKRDSPNNLSDILWAQRQREKEEKKRKKEEEEEKEAFSNTDGGDWLKQWSQGMKGNQSENEISESPVKLGIGEIDAKLVIPDDHEGDGKV